MYKKCRNCGKRFDAVDPGQWVYKIGGIYFCRWNCKRAYERQQEEQRKMRGKKITRAQKETAVQLAMEGKDPVAYLSEIGNDGRIAWGRIRLDLKKNFPERYNQLPEHQRLNPAGKVQVAEVPEKKAEEQEEEVIGTMSIETSNEIREIIRQQMEEEEENGPINEPLETGEKTMGIREPLRYEGMMVTGVTGEFGEYRVVVNNGGQWIDYRNQNRIVLTVDDWRAWLKELKHAARILGVELGTENTR